MMNNRNDVHLKKHSKRTYCISAAAFSKSLIKLEELQVEISSGLESNKSLLKGVQESFASNMEVIKGNIALLDERIKKLNKSSK